MGDRDTGGRTTRRSTWTALVVLAGSLAWLYDVALTTPLTH